MHNFHNFDIDRNTLVSCRILKVMMKLLREWDEGQLAVNSELLSRSIELLPATMSMPVVALMEQIGRENYALAMNYAIDFLEISVQYVSCCLFCRLQEVEKTLEPSARPMKAIVEKIDAKRSLSFGDWVNDIFNPIVKAALKELPDDKLVQSINKELFRRGSNLLLGTKTEPSVVKIRNEYKGHSTTLSNDIYKGVVYTLEPHILNLLRAALPIKDAEVDMYPLVFTSKEGYEYVFQSLKDEEISYISSNSNAVTLITDRKNPDFDARMQRTLPSFDISKEMNWSEHKALMKAESRRFLDGVYKEKKYNRELFVARTKLDALLDEFSKDNRTLFPLLGEAGQGKTNQLCWWTEEIAAGEDGVLIFSSSEFTEESLDDSIRRIFQTSRRKQISKILDALHQSADENRSNVYVFFDALNECLAYKGAEEGVPGPVALYESLISFFVKPEYPRFKVLFTCRNFSWKSLFSKQMKRDAAMMFGQEKDRDSEVHGFTDEELERAWAVYQELYQMSGSYDELSSVSRVRLKDPLVLKIACTNNVAKTLPSELESYTSISLFKEMTDNIANSYAGKQQYQIMLSLASHILNEYREGRPSDRVERQTLHDLCGLIYKHGGLTVAYTELLNKPERPILRYNESPDGRREVQFIYERYLEYLMAVVFVKEYAKEGALIPPETYKNAIRGTLSSVVYSGALRNALIIDCLRCGDHSTILSLARDYKDDFELSTLVNDVIDVMIRENYENEVFGLMNAFIESRGVDASSRISEYNRLTKLIQANKADGNVISNYKNLKSGLASELRLGQMATVSVIGGIFLSDWFNQGLYRRNPYDLLWKLVCHPLFDIGNESTKYIYYQHNKQYTLGHNPLKQNVSVMIVMEMFRALQEHGLFSTVAKKQIRGRAVSFFEAAGRIAMMLMIDELIYGHESDQKYNGTLMAEIKKVLSHFTYDFRIIKMLMPFFQMIMRRQITFQSAYVNNAIEYQTFWEKIPADDGGTGAWCRKHAAELAAYFVKGNQDGFVSFRNEHEKVLKAYQSGDSFSYFILERLNVVAGVHDWENIAPVMRRFFTDEYRKGEWFDYSQMSILYSLYQIQKKSPEYNQELMDMYTAEAPDWTRRCRGFFKGHYSHKANALGLYKRNVMNWYCDVYCCHTGDNVPHEGDEVAVPAFYQLIDEAVAENDIELLFHLIDNISELVSDNGYIHTALALVMHIMKTCEDNTDPALVQAIGKILSTAKNYFPRELDAFLKRDVVGLKYVGIPKFRDEVLNYSPAGETLSDLFTHSFGNFVIWSLVNMDAFKSYASDAVGRCVDCSDSFEWYDAAIRSGFKQLFGIRI